MQFLARCLFLPCRWPPSLFVLMWPFLCASTERSPVSLLIWTPVLSGKSPTLRTSFKLITFLSLKPVPLGIWTSTQELCGDTIQFITPFHCNFLLVRDLGVIYFFFSITRLGCEIFSTTSLQNALTQKQLTWETVGGQPAGY